MTIHQKHHLMLMRHGKSDWEAGVRNDLDRPLTGRGVTDVHKIGRWLDEHRYIPDLIVSSPAQRTRETAIIVAGELRQEVDLIRWDADIYEATRDRLLAVIRRYAEGSRCLLLIGHNPGLDSLLDWLAGSEPGRTASGKLMTTSALAVLSGREAIIDPAQHSLQLQQLVRPKAL